MLTIERVLGTIEEVFQSWKDLEDEETPCPLDGQTFPGIKVGDFLWYADDLESGDVYQYVVTHVDDNEQCLVAVCGGGCHVQWATDEFGRTKQEALQIRATDDARMAKGMKMAAKKLGLKWED